MNLPDETISLLICDDQPVFARALAHMLQAERDFQVLGTASDGMAAERMVNELFPDVVLMDIYMPGGTGIDACRRIYSRSPSTRVVILTVSDDEADLYRALKAGACGYITKDKDVAEVAAVVRSVANGYLVIPASLAGKMVEDLDRQDPHGLTDIERKILNGIARGETNRQIAARLSLSERTLRRRLQDIYGKLHLADRLEAAIYAAGGPPAAGDEPGPQQPPPARPDRRWPPA